MMAKVSGSLRVKVVPLPSAVLMLTVPPKRFDIAFHDVHPDAATRDVRHLFRRRETGLEDQRPDLIVGQFLVFRDQPLLDGFGENLVAIQAAPIVFDGDADVAAFVEGIEPDGAEFRLVVVKTFFRRFQPVIGRVSDEVRQRDRRSIR